MASNRQKIFLKRIQLGLLAILWLLSGQMVVVAQENSTANPQPFNVTDYMMSGPYRYPDKKPYVLPHWWNGLSVSTFWNPKMLNAQVDYQGWEMNSIGLSLIKDFSKSNALRIGYTYESGRNEWSVGHLWNLSNFFGGYDPTRRIEWLTTIDVTGGFSHYETNHSPRKFYGGQIGIQLRHTLSPYMSLYVEPQYKAVSPHYDKQWYIGNVVDDGLSLQIGLVTRLTGPFREDAYGKYAHQAFSWLYDVGARIFVPDGLKVNRNHGMQRWYAQLLGGVQLSTINHGFSDLKLHPFSFEMNVGRRINSIYSFQTGVFQESLSFASGKGNEETFGLRVEMVADLLRAIWPIANQRGWAWTLSAGGEAGRVQTWDHFYKAEYHQYSPTAASQLRYRLDGALWLVAQGRVQMIRVGSDNLQMVALAGIHYDMSSRRGQKNNGNKQLDKFWLSISDGWWNAKKNIFSASIGYDFTPVHGLRMDYSFAKTGMIKYNSDKQADWTAFSLDYSANISNAVLGNEGLRRFNLYMLYGYNVAVHNEGSEDKLLHTSSYVGMEAGTQFEFCVNRHLSFFAEEKTLFLPFDLHLNPNSQQSWNMIGTAGIKIRL